MKHEHDQVPNDNLNSTSTVCTMYEPSYTLLFHLTLKSTAII